MTANDLLYIPRNIGEMNFSTFTAVALLQHLLRFDPDRPEPGVRSA